MTRPEFRTPAYTRGDFRQVSECEVFLSSGSDLDEQRALFKDLVDAFNQQAIDARTDYRIVMVAWEEAITRKTYGDGNAEFRYDASVANLVVVLLHRELRRGTEEELKKALESPSVQTAIIWMDPPPDDTPETAEKKLLAKMRKLKGDIRWHKTKGPDDISVVIAMVKILARVFVQMSSPRLEQPAGEFTEAR